MNDASILAILGGLISIAATIITATWKLSQIKEELGRDYVDRINRLNNTLDQRIDALNTREIQLDTALRIMQTNLDNELKALNTRVTTLHTNSKRKYADLITVVNQHTAVLNKLQKDTHIYQVRSKDTMGFNGDNENEDDSWTQI